MSTEYARQNPFKKAPFSVASIGIIPEYAETQAIIGACLCLPALVLKLFLMLPYSL